MPDKTDDKQRSMMAERPDVAPPGDSPCLIFVHLPKCAGATLTRIITRQYSHRETFTIDGVHRQWSIDKFRSLPERRRRGLRCVIGHMPFGLHRWLPQGATYVSMIRHPVSRVISDYHYVRRTRRHRLHEDAKRRELSLEDYVRRQVFWHGNNLQTRWLSGQVDMNSTLPPYEPLSRDALDVAKTNLEHSFATCGMLEQFDKSVLLMKAVLGWESVCYRRKNVAPDRTARCEIPGATLDLITESENLDLQLYDWVRARLDRLADERSICGDDVAALQTANLTYSTPRHTWESSVHLLRSSIRKARIYTDRMIPW